MAEIKDRRIKKHDVCELLLAGLLAFIMICGIIISMIPKTVSLTGPIKEHLTGVFFAYVFFFIAFLVLIKSLFCVFDRRSAKENSAEKNSIVANSWGRTTLIILVCWLPYLIICYPAVTRGYDYFWQVLMGTGVFPLSNHHPVLSSLVIGVLFKIGNAIGGSTFGLAFSMFVQSICMAAAAGYSLSYICSVNKVSAKTSLALLFLICFSPVFPGHAMFLVKDSLFTAFGIMFFTQCYMRINCLKANDKMPIIASYPAIIIIGVFFSLYRNGVKPITLTMFAVLLFAEIRSRDKGSKERKYLIKWGAALIAFMAITLIWNQMLSSKNVYPTDKREALAMPTRQIIRTVQLHPKALTGSVEQVLETAYQRKLSLGMKLPEVVAKYDDMNADYIKIDYVDEEDFLARYIKLWISLGLKHPGSYIDAFLRGADGYWYPMKNPHLEAQGVVIHTICTTGQEEDFANEGMRKRQFKSLFYPTVKSLESAGVDVEQTFEDIYPHYPWLEELMNVRSAFPEGRKIFGLILAGLEDVPIVSMILAPGTYFCIMIICFAYLFSRKKNGRFMWPILMIEAIAWLSPVNGYTRYILLIEFFSIIMIGMCFEKDSEKQ